MSKKLYVVRGSEDGNLGIYSSARKAVEKAVDYSGEGKRYKTEYNVKSGITELNKQGWLTISRLHESGEHNNFASSEIGIFYLNE
jgi:hypothetical protein